MPADAARAPYGPGGYNTLHQDLYGDVAFPLQVVVGLTAPGVDYTGGEFVLTEQRPRSQTRATAAGRWSGARGSCSRTTAARCLGSAGRLSGHASSRRQRGALGPSVGARPHLPRRPLTARLVVSSGLALGGQMSIPHDLDNGGDTRAPARSAAGGAARSGGARAVSRSAGLTGRGRPRPTCGPFSLRFASKSDTFTHREAQMHREPERQSSPSVGSARTGRAPAR